MKSGSPIHLIYFQTLICLVFTAIFPVQTISAAPLQLDVEPLRGQIIGHHLEILEDKGKQWTFDDIQSERISAAFKPSEQEKPKFGLSTTSAIWLRLQVLNESMENLPWILEIENARLDHVDLYVSHPDGVIVIKSGDQLPFSSRELPFKNPAFRVNSHPGISTYYLRVASGSQLIIPVRVWQEGQFEKHRTLDLIVISVFYSLLLILGLYNLFIFLSARDPNYLYLVFFIFARFFLDILMWGYGAQVFWPNHPALNDLLPVATTAFTVAMAVFYRSLLDAPTRAPRLDYLFKAIMALSVLGLILSLIIPLPEIAEKLTVLFLAPLTLFLFGVSLVVSGYLSFRGVRAAKYLFAGSTLVLFNGILSSLDAMVMSQSVANSLIIQNTGKVSFVILMLVLSLAVSDTINTMKRELEQKVKLIKESEARFRGLVETSTDLIWEVDAAGCYTYISPQLETMLGYRPEELIGQSPLSLMPPEIAGQMGAALLEITGKGAPIKAGEVPYLHKDGSQLFLESAGVPVLDNAGQVNGYRGIDRNITERKQQEEELRQLRNYLINIIDSMPSVLIGVDMEGRVTQWNKRAEQALGISADSARGRGLSEVFPQMAAEMEKIRESIRTGVSKQEQKRSHAPGEGNRHEDITIYPLIANGAEGAVIRVDDVTEKVRMEEMMIQTEKMMSVGGLAAGMAHEINNPLGGMLQGIQNVQRRLSPDIKKNREPATEFGIDLVQLQSYMEKRGVFALFKGIQDSGKRASDIVKSMLQFSRKSESKRAPIQITDLIENTLELAGKSYDIKKKIDFRDIEIIKEWEPNLPPIPCTETEIEQVLLNLLNNAAWAMTAGGSLISPQITLRVLRDNGMVRIEVEDNGPGIDKPVLSKIFEPFFTTKPVNEGTGLGLSVSYMIVTQNHQGTMTVESEPGKGTRFVVRLPLEYT